MAATKRTITVETPVGTFTRTTARVYTALVLVSPDLATESGRARTDWHVFNWCGTVALAEKAARQWTADGWAKGAGREVRIWDVENGRWAH